MYRQTNPEVFHRRSGRRETNIQWSLNLSLPVPRFTQARESAQNEILLDVQVARSFQFVGSLAFGTYCFTPGAFLSARIATVWWIR